MFGHREFQQVIDVIIDLAEQRRQGAVATCRRRRPTRPIKAQAEGPDRQRAWRGLYAMTVKQHRYAKRRRSQDEGARRCSRTRPRRPSCVAPSVQGAREPTSCAAASSTTGKPHRRPRRPTTVRPIVSGGRRAAARARFGAVHPRRDAGAGASPRWAPGQDEQIIDALEGEYRENFLLHYNFPPYSVGEAGRMGSPGRREIGHGKLAWRAHPAAAAEQGRVPLHDARRLGDHRDPTARPRWPRCAAPRWR